MSTFCRCNFQQSPLLLLHLQFPLALKGHCLPCQSAPQPHPPCPASCRQVCLHFHSQTFVKSTSFKFDTRQEYSHLMFNVSLLPIQVCLQSLFCPPPLTPHSPLCLRWILPLPAWTQPPRYQVISARFTPFLNKDTSLCVHITHIQWTYSCWRFPTLRMTFLYKASSTTPCPFFSPEPSFFCSHQWQWCFVISFVFLVVICA